MEERLPIEGLYLRRSDLSLHLRSEKPIAVLSSSVVGADLTQVRHIINMHVGKDDNSQTPWKELAVMAHELGIREPFIGLITAARLDRAQVIVEQGPETTAVAIVTVGLAHPVSAGVTEAGYIGTGTINIILAVNARLSPAARVNAVITATEAKTLALVEAGIRSPEGVLASGTGTDAIVIATAECGPEIEYAGPVSPAGSLIARAVRRAIKQNL